LKKIYNPLIASVCLLLAVCFLPGGTAFSDEAIEETAIEGSGPISFNNQMPLYLFFLQMKADKTQAVKRNEFKVLADYTVSNITASAFTPCDINSLPLYDIDIDMEVSRINLDLRYGLYDDLEVGLEVPYIYLSEGYLDGFIEDTEDFIGARTPRSRRRQGRGNFDYSLKYDNQFVIQEKEAMEGLGDIVLGVKYHAFKEKGKLYPNVSFRAALKLPTGDKDNFIGSGEVDYGFGVLFDKCFFDRLFAYSALSAVIIKEPSFLDRLPDMDNAIYSGMFGLEYFFGEKFSVITQVSGHTSPYPEESDTNVLENPGTQFALGAKYYLDKKNDILLHFSVIENIHSAASPDVTFQTGLKWAL